MHPMFVALFIETDADDLLGGSIARSAEADEEAMRALVYHGPGQKAAIDQSDARLEAAKQFGADVTLSGPAGRALRRLT